MSAPAPSSNRGPGIPYTPESYTQSSSEEKAYSLNLDPGAMEALQKLGPEEQEAILAEVNPLACRNPSAVVITKIAEMRSGGVKSRDRSRTPTPGFGMGAGTGMGAPAKTTEPGEIGEVDEKAYTLNLDQGALEELSKLPMEHQQKILADVNPEVVRNPSAVVITKIHEMSRKGGFAQARSQAPLGGKGFGGSSQGAAPSMNSGLQAQLTTLSSAGSAGVSAFAGQVGLDGRASKALSDLTGQEAHIVMALVAKENCKNISAVTWSKVKKVKDNPYEAKMEYLRGAIDEGASKALDALPLDVQESVLEDIDVTKCRNLSAVVWSKVKGTNGGTVPVTPRQPSARPPQAQADGGDVVLHGSVALDARATEALNQLTPEDQLRVLNEVEAQPTVNNPSAFVWSRIKKLRETNIFT